MNASRLNVVPVMETNGADIAQQLRQMADRFESGDLVDIDTAIFIHDNPTTLYGWGKIDGMRCIGLLNLASHKLMRDTLDWADVEQEEGGAA
jgi:hypothetical protein